MCKARLEIEERDKPEQLIPAREEERRDGVERRRTSRRQVNLQYLSLAATVRERDVRDLYLAHAAKPTDFYTVQWGSFKSFVASLDGLLWLVW